MTTAQLETQVVTGQPQNCQPVGSFRDLEAIKQDGKNFRFGAKGFYADSAEGDCYLLDVHQEGFQDTYPDVYKEHRNIKAYTEKLLLDGKGAPGKREERDVAAPATPGCNQACEGPNAPCLYPCYCYFLSNFCSPYGCYDIYGCR
jgi:hypothetical protein